MRITATATCFVATLIATPASAGEFYASLAGGVSDMAFAEVEGAGLDRLRFRNGAAVDGAVGYAFDGGLRLELEGAWRENSPEEFRRHHAPGWLNVGGDVQVWTAFANAAWDFGRADGWPIQPYLEGGLGALVADIETGRPDCTCPGRRERQAAHGSGWTNVVPAWQVGAGVNVPVNERVTLFGGVRYMRALTTPELNGGESGANFGGGSEWEIAAATYRVGLRVGF